jgi:hypothetical protein
MRPVPDASTQNGRVLHLDVKHAAVLPTWLDSGL